MAMSSVPNERAQKPPTRNGLWVKIKRSRCQLPILKEADINPLNALGILPVDGAAGCRATLSLVLRPSQSHDVIVGDPVRVSAPP